MLNALLRRVIFFKNIKFQEWLYVCLALIVAGQMVFVPKGLAIEVVIPEIKSRVSDAFVLESIAKLDDFIEDIRTKENVRGVETVGFGTNTIVQLGTITGIMLDQFIFRKNLVSGVVDEVKKVATAGRAGKLPFDLSTFTRRWFVGTSAANIATAEKEKTFTVHVQDLAMFREILMAVRQQQYGILIRIWKEAATAGNDDVYRSKIANAENLIREQRPSFKNIYEACLASPSNYKSEMMMEVYSQGLKDYFSALLLTPAAISRQVNAGFISPTLNSYISQDVLPIALRKCFKVPMVSGAVSVSGFEKAILGIPYLGAGVSMATDISRDEHQRFIAQLFAVDTAARFVVFAAVFSIYKFKDIFRNVKKPKVPVGKFQNTWLGDSVRYVQALFQKISPKLIARVVVTTQVLISSYSLYMLKKEYNKTTEVGQNRGSADSFNHLAKKYFHDQAVEQIQELQKVLSVEGIDTKGRAEVEKEIHNWHLIEVEFAS